jgi:hypothetical protein
MKAVKNFVSCILLFSWLVAFTACNDVVSRDYLAIRSYQSTDIGIRLNLAIKRATYSPSGTCFSRDENLTELKTLLETDTTDYAYELYDDRYILIEYEAEDYIAYFIIAYISNYENNIYDATNMNCGLNLDYGLIDMMLPYHLFSDDFRILSSGITVNTEYEVSGTIDDFYNFYNDGGFTVTITDNKLEVSNPFYEGNDFTIELNEGKVTFYGEL